MQWIRVVSKSNSSLVVGGVLENDRLRTEQHSGAREAIAALAEILRADTKTAVAIVMFL